MAYMSPVSIATRIREVLDGGYGLARTVSSSRFSAAWHEAMSQDEQSRLAVSSPRFNVTPVSLKRSGSTLPSSNIWLWDIELKVTTARHLNTAHKVIESLRDDVLALANIDADYVAQALGYLGNVLTTNAAVATGLIGGKLELISSTHTVEASGNGSLVTTEHMIQGKSIVSLDAASEEAPTTYIYGLDAGEDRYNNGYISTNTNFLTGSETMTWAFAAYLSEMPTAPFGSIGVIAHSNLSNPGSIYFFCNQTTLGFRIHTTDGLYGGPVHTFATSDVGKYHTIAATYSGNVLRMYVNGNQIGNGITTIGTIVTDSVFGLAFLRQFSGGDVNPFYWIVGLSASETVALSSAQVSAWDSICRAQYTSAGFSGCTYRWVASDIPNTESPWTDAIGGQNMTKNGPPTDCVVHATPATSVVWGT